MEILEDSPSYKIITRRTDPDQPSRVLKSYHPDTNPHTGDITCPDNVFRKEVFSYYITINRVYNSYNYFLTPNCVEAIVYNERHFNVKHNRYYETLVIYNSIDNEPMPESLLTWIELLSDVVLVLVNYNHPLDNLPSSIRVLILDSNNKLPNYKGYEYSHSLNNLPNNLEELILNVNYFGSLNYLPPLIKHLHIRNCTRELSINNLPSGLLELHLPHYEEYEPSLNDIQSNLKIFRYYMIG